MYKDFYRAPALSGIFIVNQDVNIDDLIGAHSGGIVRVEGNVQDCVRYITDDLEPYQCVAGWVSENV